MAEIPLQDYIATIEGQLSGAAADEAAYHSRHLLSRYPKYTAAYRLLGRALLLKGQHDEAEAAFRRVLSVEPNDRIAHLGLSEIHDRRHRGDEAIWHAERALELDATDQAASDMVHALYRRYQGQERARMGLTAVTLARQAIQNRDFDQAVQTLRSAIERQPDRIDLKLLLAEALWASGDHISGAEAASDVLDVLPDCLQANTILSRLWLENGRPSDARPFLNRIESLDPYAALALVTGQPAEADAFTIEPLDYQRSAQSDVARVEPDWLQGLPSAPPPVTEAPSATPEWISGMLATTEVPASRLPDAQSDELSSTTLTPLPASAEDEDLPDFAALTAEPSDLDDLFGGIEATLLETPAAELPAPDPFAEAAPAGDILPDLDSSFGEGQETPALGASPFDFSEPSPAPPPAGVTAPLQAHDPSSPARLAPAEDALAWLRESGVELVDDEAPVLDSDLASGFPTVESSDTLDPMAWLNSYDTVLAEIEPAAESELPPAGAEGQTVEDWQNEPWDPNAVDLAAFTSEAEEPAADEDELAVSGSGAPALRGLTSRLGDPALAPPPAPTAPPTLSDDAVLDEWLSQFDVPSGAEPDQANPEWLTDLGVTMSNEPESTPIEPGHDSDLPLPADESADWLKELQPEVANEEQVEPVLPADDWMAQIESTSGTASESLPDWLAETAVELPSTERGAPAPEAAGEGFDWLDSLNAPADEQVEAVDEAVMAAQADVPDWLNALEAEALATIDAHMASPEPEDAVAATEAAAAIEALPFDEPAEAAEPVEAASEAALDEKQPAEASAETFAAEWDTATTEPAAAVPELELELDAEAFTASAEGEVTPEPPPAQDWGEPEMADLSRIAPPTVGLENLEPGPAEPVSPDDWFADGELAAEAPVPAEGSMPAAGEDWFTDAELQAPALEVEAAPEPDAEAVNWQSEMESEAAVTQVGSETMVMAGELTEPEEAAAATEAALREEAAGTPPGVLAFGSDDEVETASGEPLAEAPGDETEAWLGEEWPEEAESPFLSPDELDELPDAEIVEEVRIAPAANAPDWLNAMVPGLDLDYGASEDEPLEREFAEPGGGALDSTLGARSEYAWVIELVEQEEHATAPAPAEAAAEMAAEAADEPRYVFSRLPAWFRGSGEDDDDFADWPGDDSSLPAWQN